MRGRWAPGARLLFYTDGLVEARGTAGTFLQLEEHAAVLRDPSLDLSLDRLMERLMERLLRHTGHRLNDDMALVLAERR